jgi:hypothetical protein
MSYADSPHACRCDNAGTLCVEIARSGRFPAAAWTVRNTGAAVQDTRLRSRVTVRFGGPGRVRRETVNFKGSQAADARPVNLRGLNRVTMLQLDQNAITHAGLVDLRELAALGDACPVLPPRSDSRLDYFDQPIKSLTHILIVRQSPTCSSQTATPSG